MLKGLKGILEKGLRIAAPIIGAATPLGPVLGAAAGSGIASLLAGDKPRDALLQAGLAGLGGKFGLFGKGAPAQATSGGGFSGPGFLSSFTRPTGGGGPVSASGNLFSKIGGALFDSAKGRPTALGTSLAVGLPAILAGVGAAQDARKAGPMDPADYESAVDKMYGGKFAPPPSERRITNLDPRITNPQTVFQTSPPSRANGGIMGVMSNEPISYSAMDGSPAGIGSMAMADGGQTFPRKTGMITGPGGPKDDKIPAMLSNGEFVFTAKAVDRAGGPRAMYNMMNKLDPESEKPSERA